MDITSVVFLILIGRSIRVVILWNAEVEEAGILNDVYVTLWRVVEIIGSEFPFLMLVALRH